MSLAASGGNGQRRHDRDLAAVRVESSLTERQAWSLINRFFDAGLHYVRSGVEACSILAELYDGHALEAVDKPLHYLGAPLGLSDIRLLQRIQAGRIWRRTIKFYSDRELAWLLKERCLCESGLRALAPLMDAPEKLRPALDDALVIAERTVKREAISKAKHQGRELAEVHVRKPRLTAEAVKAAVKKLHKAATAARATNHDDDVIKFYVRLTALSVRAKKLGLDEARAAIMQLLKKRGGPEE